MPDPLLDKKNRPDYKCATSTQCEPAITLWRDVCGGTPTMRAAGTKYLPKEPREAETDYNARLNRSVFFDAARKTREALVGAVFKKEIVVGDDVPAEITNQTEDIDLQGNHLDVFCKRLFTDQFEGYAFILVDMEAPLESSATTLSLVPTLADERISNRRPYWVKYKSTDAVNWRTAKINGEFQFTQITFQETNDEPSGEYGEMSVTRYRTFRLNAFGFVEWELNRIDLSKPDDQQVILEDAGATKLTRIPVAVAGVLGDPPVLSGLASLNIQHWQNVSDQENILHITRVPQLVVIGAPEDQAPQRVVKVTGRIDLPEGANAFWLEIKNDGATKAGREHILDIEQRMGMIGLSTLTQRQDSQVTATEKRLDYDEKHSELSTMARSLKDAIELALKFHAIYLGLPEGGSVELGVAEEGLILTPRHMQVLLAAVTAGELSRQTFLTAVLNMLQDAGVMAKELDVQDELDQIAKETPKNPPILPPAQTPPGGLNLNPADMGAGGGAN